MSSRPMISHCRICGNTSLIPVLDLGEQALTGIFPKSTDGPPGSGPLRLVKCGGEGDTCGLLQLAHSFDPNEMYGDNYGYRSGLNRSMVTHLQGKIEQILHTARLKPGDLVIDIGSNDGTSLKAYPAGLYDLVGIDPTAEKFRDFYPSNIEIIPDFFAAATVAAKYGTRRARVITSFSMFYDLEQPLEFMREVHQVLEDDGVWVTEQSYMPAMVDQNAYDTICHEHVEYYALRQIKWMADHTGFKIVDLELNDINGGSFSIVLAKSQSPFPEYAGLKEHLARETERGFDGLEPFRAFADRIQGSKAELVGFLREAKAAGKTVLGLGASTKGNVLLQFCGITEQELPAIGEVNAEKYGCRTPGSGIPIISEEEVLSRQPDYLLVLPWHFHRFFEASPKFSSSRLVFPLPQLRIVEPS